MASERIEIIVSRRNRDINCMTGKSFWQSSLTSTKLRELGQLGRSITAIGSVGSVHYPDDILLVFGVTRGLIIKHPNPDVSKVSRDWEGIS